MADIVVHVVDDQAALLTVIGTLGGVLVGALAAWWRQRSQITAERARLAAQLDDERDTLHRRLEAESERLRERLEHDRKMRELEVLREVLDGALAAARMAYLAAWDAVDKRKFGDSVFAGALVVLPGSRLLIRLRRDHPVVQDFLAVRDALGRLRVGIARPIDGGSVDLRVEECRLQLDETAELLKEFADAAATLAGTPLVEIESG